MSGKRLLIDPVFGELPVGKRLSNFPVPPERLLGIDYVLVSHAHYDHCDKDALELLTRNNPGIEILAGLGLDRVIRKWTARPIHTAGWLQQYDLKGDIQITFIPSRP